MSWSLGKNMIAQFVSKAVRDDITIENVEEGLIIHSDKGVNSVVIYFLKNLKKVKTIPHMSAPGTLYNNALMDSFFNTLKNELKETFPFKSFAEEESHLFQYIEIFYNRERILQLMKYQRVQKGF